MVGEEFSQDKFITIKTIFCILFCNFPILVDDSRTYIQIFCSRRVRGLQWHISNHIKIHITFQTILSYVDTTKGSGEEDTMVEKR